MGDSCGADIEPEDQTILADATESISGVLCASVPGAGGNDALYAITLSKESRNNVELLWSQWGQVDGIPSERVVCPLILKAATLSEGGIKNHSDILWTSYCLITKN